MAAGKHAAQIEARQGAARDWWAAAAGACDRGCAQVVSPNDILVIVGHQAETVQAAVRDNRRALRGAGGAAGDGACHPGGGAGTQEYDELIVLSGDVPLLRPETVLALRDFHLRERAAMTVLTAVPADPSATAGCCANRRRAGGDGDREQKALEPEQLGVREINSGIYGFQRKALFQHIGQLRANNLHQELYLTDMARILHDAGDGWWRSRPRNPKRCWAPIRLPRWRSWIGSCTWRRRSG